MTYLHVFLLAHIVYSAYTTVKIIQSKQLDKFQKKAHTILTWLIPFIWGSIVKKLTKKREFKTITKKDRNHKPGGTNASGSIPLEAGSADY
ncbi:MAG: hypothetical protein ACI9U0_001775 [Flavobacteriales bacterium]|jgi:hypothetical protein|tara:strand:- start:6 stop:278 length:273 start_codon:yes stop_codon:yes gene_type:complete